MLFATASVLYAFVATEWYRSEVLLAPAEAMAGPNLGGQLGGLALLAGVSVDRGNTPEAIATLQSREFVRDFIEHRGLLPLIFSGQWDASANRWINGNGDGAPDIRDAVEVFRKRVLRVDEQPSTGLVRVTVEWTDPELAADWAASLVQQLNIRLRERALIRAESNISYLQEELTQTTVVTLHQSIGRLLESEFQNLMLARGNDEFAFRVIDGATVPKDRVWPKRSLIVVLATILGGMLGVVGVLAIHALASVPRSPEHEVVQ